MDIPEEATIVESENATLEVKFNKDVSRKRVVWLKNGKELKSSRKYKIVRKDFSALLTINNVTTEDMGDYTIKVEEAKGIIPLIVEEKPKPNPPVFVQVPKALDITEGNIQSFATCCLTIFQLFIDAFLCESLLFPYFLVKICIVHCCFPESKLINFK